MEALQADASRLLAEYDSSNSAGNKLQRRLLTCEHTFQLLNDRFSCILLAATLQKKWSNVAAGLTHQET